MTRETRTVELTKNQIDFVLTSLSYSAKAVRDTSYRGEDPTLAAERRNNHDAMIMSIREALSAARQ